MEKSPSEHDNGVEIWGHLHLKSAEFALKKPCLGHRYSYLFFIAQMPKLEYFCRASLEHSLCRCNYANFSTFVHVLSSSQELVSVQVGRQDSILLPLVRGRDAQGMLENVWWLSAPKEIL